MAEKSVRRKRGRKAPASGRLNERQRRFVAEYLVDLNATQAAIRAGYSEKTAASQASDLLRNPKVAEAIRVAQDKRLQRIEITADRVLQELALVAFADIGRAFGKDGGLLPLLDMPEEVRRALAGVEVDELFEGRGDERQQVGVTRKIKMNDKLRGLEMLGKHLRLFTESVELSGAGGAPLGVVVLPPLDPTA